MAHSQIVVEIAFSLAFEMDVAIVRNRWKRLLQLPFFNRHLQLFVLVCYRLLLLLLLLALVWSRILDV